MYYTCQPLFEKGKRLPAWQTAFGHRFDGLVVIAYELIDHGYKLPVARLLPLPGQPAPDNWPKPLYGVSQLEEDREARFLTGSEFNHSVTADRYLTQVWQLTPLPLDVLRQVAEFEAGQAARMREAVDHPQT